MKIAVVGNGPSLSVEQLDMVHAAGIPSIACNRINLIYPKTTFRPTIYVHPESLAPDIPFIQENIDLGITCWVGEHFMVNEHRTEGIRPSEKTHPIKDCHHHLLNFDSPDLPDEWHFPQPCTFGGSVSWAMQRAILDGYDELILLGCDLQYRDRKQSHFDPAYEHGGEQPAFFAARNALYGHFQGMNYIRRRKIPVRIWNATTGGKLEIWERKALTECLEYS